MDTRSSIKQWMIVGWLVFSFVVSGCTALPGAQVSTPDVNSGTRDAPDAAETAPSVIHFPEVERPKWVKSVSSLCILVEQSYPTLPAKYKQPIGEELQAIFKRIGVLTSLGEGADCQATLSIQLEITPISELVAGAGTCYLDAGATGRATLSAQGQETLEMALRVSPAKHSGITVVSECPKSPAEAPIDSTWAAALGPMLREWWGSPALVSMLDSE